MAVVLYGPPIQDAIAAGDLARMKQLAAEAEEHLKQVGNVRAALEYLKLEIAKLSRKPGH
jgi:phage shock protein A